MFFREAGSGRGHLLRAGTANSRSLYNQGGGISRPTWNFPQNWSQAILAGIILLGRLGVDAPPPAVLHACPDRRRRGGVPRREPRLRAGRPARHDVDNCCINTSSYKYNTNNTITNTHTTTLWATAVVASVKSLSALPLLMLCVFVVLSVL